MSIVHFLELALTALTIAIAGTAFARRIAVQTGVVDRSGGSVRKGRAMPLLGGVAIYVAFVASLILFRSLFNMDQLIGILVGATLVSFLGLWDDRKPASPVVKLCGQLAAAVVVVAAGVKIELLGVLWADFVLAILWILYITNAFNLLDNMDGLSAGVAAIAAASFLALAGLNGQYLVGALAAALLGACLGFLVFNFNPARIFMGDAGSLFIGFVMAALAIKMRFPGQSQSVSWMVPVVVLGVPICDTAFVIVQRVSRGKAFWKGGKDHLSHRLVDLGLKAGWAVVCLYVLSLLFGLSGTAISILNPVPARVVAGVSGGVAVVALVWLELTFRSRQKVMSAADAPLDRTHQGRS
jgi:UDP-GlcNAc:undecaprenyl-phosphate GlcNAc-1-phosphate transferase